MAETKPAEKAEPKSEVGKNSQFKYTGGRDTGVNEFQSVTYYDIQFPKGVAVEVPDSLVHKLRTKDELEEVSGNVLKTSFEKHREQENKRHGKSSRSQDSEEINPEELQALREKAARFDAQVEKVRADAQRGR